MNIIKQKYQGSLEYLLVIGGAIMVAAIVLMVLSGTSVTNNETAIDNSKCSPYGNQNYCNIADIDGDGIVDCYWKDNQCNRYTLYYDLNLVKQGLIIFLKMEDSNTTHTAVIQDSSGIGNNGILYTGEGATSKSVAGRYGNAITFDGTNDYISTNFTLNGLSSFTISGWIYPIGISSVRTSFFGQNDSYETIWTGSTCMFWTPSGNISTNVSTEQWLHFVLVFTGTKIHIYKNGILSISGNSTGGSSAFKFNIGGGGIADPIETNGNYLIGLIDEVAVWNRALSEKEIKLIYENELR